jgi:hypothetical protein
MSAILRGKNLDIGKAMKRLKSRQISRPRRSCRYVRAAHGSPEMAYLSVIYTEDGILATSFGCDAPPAAHDRSFPKNSWEF